MDKVLQAQAEFVLKEPDEVCCEKRFYGWCPDHGASLWTVRDLQRRNDALQQQIDAIQQQIDAIQQQIDAINTPEILDFVKAVQLEAQHQRLKWGADGDAGKSDLDWYWLLGYLAQKAVNGPTPEKRLHHCITTAAACLNWHAAKLGVYAAMRPGIEAPAEEKV